MPRFFFHYHSPEGSSRDDTGCTFDTLEHAYVDAFRSAVDIGAEMLKAHCNPARHRIDIADANGRVLTEVRFDDIFRRARVEPSRAPLSRLLHDRLETFDVLRQDMKDTCAAARANVAKAHEVLRRARAMS